MNLRSAIEIGLVSLGIAGGGVTFYEMVLQREAITSLQKNNQELRKELTNEEVDRCLTDNVVKLVIRNVGGPNFNDKDCSTEYAPEYTPDTAPGGSRQQITPQTN